MRATAKTTLVLGDLIQVPVAICTAKEDNDVKLSSPPAPPADEPDGAPVGESSTAIDDVPDEAELTEPTFTKGIKTGRGDAAAFHPIPDALLSEVKDDTQLDELQVIEFCDYRKVPTERITAGFWIQPEKGFAKPLRVLIEAMRSRQLVAVVRFALRGRQQIGVLRVRKAKAGNVLLLSSVAYAANWRVPDKAVEMVATVDEPAEPQVTAAIALVDQLTGDGASLNDSEDPFVSRMADLAERAENGEWDHLLDEVPAPAEPAEVAEAKEPETAAATA